MRQADNYAAALAIQGQSIARAGTALLKTLSAAIRSGDLDLKGTPDMCAFVRQALEELQKQIDVFDLLQETTVANSRQKKART